MVSKERDRARRNRQRFRQLLNELEQQDRDIAELYEQAGLDVDDHDAATTATAPPPADEPAPTPPPLRGFVVRV